MGKDETTENTEQENVEQTNQLETPELERRDYPQSERDNMDDSDFGDPENKAFPIKTAQDVINAASRLHNSKGDQSAIKARIKRIAKRKGFALPQTWQEEDGKSDDKKERSEDPQLHALFMPINYLARRDADEWIVEGQATAEVPDSYGTIFTYEASKKAFQNWYGKYANVREMHGKNAVGKGIAVRYDDANKRILVRTRVSKAEPGVWTKFHEGVLNGFSIGAGSNYKMGRMSYGGKSYPAITDYELAELSYVDNPSCPGSDACIVSRAAEGQEFVLSELIDDSDPEPATKEEPTTQEPPQTIETPELERAGARLSADSKAALHDMRDKAMALCGCDECQAMCDDGDGDEDADMERLQRLITPALERAQSSIFQRHNAILARYSQEDTHYTDIQERLDKLEKTLEQFRLLGEIKETLERVANASTLDEVRADMSAVKDQVEKIAKTPMPGGPIQNGARPPYEKNLPYQQEAPQHQDRMQVERETLQRLNAMGAFQTTDDQTAAAALLLRPMQGMR